MVIKNRCRPNKSVLLLVGSLFFAGQASTQFLDDFNKTSIALDRHALSGWTFYTGDGSAIMDLRQQQGFASILVDATNDQRNIWWALIRRCVSAQFDLSRLSEPKYEFRIEACIRTSHAPRRVNLHLNTQRTTDFHSHLMEFDIPDTVNWHVISMTTHDFDAKPGDRVYGQLALMDWGLGRYQVDLDYFKVDIVNVDSAGPDKGAQVPYHPPLPDLKTYSHHLAAAQDATIDLEYPEMNFNNWQVQEEGQRTSLLAVNTTQFTIMRWDLAVLAQEKVVGCGVLELTTHMLQRSSDYQKDFGMVRVVEILGGDPAWEQANVTYRRLGAGQPLDRILNSQMIIDFAAAPEHGGKNFIVIPRPVMQRMLEGKTFGLALRSLGAVHAAFYALENRDENLSPKLHINVAAH